MEKIKKIMSKFKSSSELNKIQNRKSFINSFKILKSSNVKKINKKEKIIKNSKFKIFSELQKKNPKSKKFLKQKKPAKMAIEALVFGAPCTCDK